jgi:hypothetical protein
MIVALPKLGSRVVLSVVPKAIAAQSVVLRTSTKMATSDDERWPDPSNYPRGEKLDHLQQLRAKRSDTKQEDKPIAPVAGDEHSPVQPIVPDVEELKLHAQEEKMKKDKEDEIRHHAWE